MTGGDKSDKQESDCDSGQTRPGRDSDIKH